MTEQLSSFRWIDHVNRGRAVRALGLSVLAFALGACGGGGGGGTDNASASGGGTAAVATPTTSATGATALAAASTLTMSISGVSINSPPVVSFIVTNQSGVGMGGLTSADLRFGIAKLIPGTNGGPSNWQSYINRASGGAVQGTVERSATGSVFGTLTDNGGGSYTYKFATDITAGNACPAPCTDAEGKPLDIGYQPGATHRLTIQQANSAYPRSAGIFDFVPNGGAGSKREVVADATCNQCHSQLTGHGTRVEQRFCVTCHNPGSWVAGTPNTPVDFKVMVHKIHYNKAGAALPSVLAGTPYKVNGTDFSKVKYLQDVRNCTVCHDGTAGSAIQTAQGDNWKTQPSIEACGACHDNVYFSAKPDAAKPYQTKPHSGGVQTDNSSCALCHAAGKYTDKKDIVVAHKFASTVAAATAKFKLNIISATPTTAGSTPVITFSVTDPSNGDKPYDIKADKPFTQTASGTSTLNVKLGWTATGSADIGNDGSGLAYAQPITINALTASVAGATAGTYTVTSPTAIAANGTLRVMMDGHLAGDVTTAGTFTDQLRVTSVFRDFAITGTATARRTVVDAAKCNVCHGTLSAHGNNRNNEPQVCAICHNPNATDADKRAGVTGCCADSKTEESIDFKTVIHAIHAGQSDKGGFRTKGITVYGFNVANAAAGGKPGVAYDFSGVVFPGRLSNCTQCHTTTSYQLSGTWANPTGSGVLGTTFDSQASNTLSTDNLRITPTAAVCASCHDGSVALSHMKTTTSGGNFSATQATISAAVTEACSLCHGPGRAVDVKTMHKVQ